MIPGTMTANSIMISNCQVNLRLLNVHINKAQLTNDRIAIVDVNIQSAEIDLAIRNRDAV
jgi:hypothetical protein